MRERERERERESLIWCDDMLKRTIKYKISPNFTDVIGCIKTSSKSYWTFYVNSINGFDQLYLYISHTHTYTWKYLHERWIWNFIAKSWRKAFKTVKKWKQKEKKRKKKIIRIIISKELKKSADLSCNLKCSESYYSFVCSKTRIQS